MHGAPDPDRQRLRSATLDAMHGIEQTMLFTVRWIFATDRSATRDRCGVFCIKRRFFQPRSLYYPIVT